MTSTGDWGEIIDEVETKSFVGRELELDVFRRQIGLSRPRYLIFFVTGQGGVGKTTLLNRYRQIAQDFGFLLTDCSEQQQDIPAVLGRFAHQLTEQGCQLKRFEKRYKVYRQKVDEIAIDPEAPPEVLATLSRLVIRGGYVAGDLVPGLSKGLEYIPSRLLEDRAIKWATYLSKKLSNKDDVILVSEPIPILTSLFFEDLNEFAKNHRVLLCFENFEATRQELQEWLLRLREYKPSQNIRLAIAGRDKPGAEWDSLRNATMTIHLNTFTEQEAELFLDAYNITNIKRRNEILEWSGRLPVLMSWLASQEGEETDPYIPTTDIVERFLRWVNEPATRQVALLAAIPRSFNVDVLLHLLENHAPIDDVQIAFDWLQSMPFVQQYSDGWKYHGVVRRMMNHYQRKKSPRNYQQAHTTLANFYQAKNDELHLSYREQWTNQQWIKNTSAYLYHFLAADPEKHWGEIMSLFVEAIREDIGFAIQIVDVLILDDIHDELSHQQNDMVQLLKRQLQLMQLGKLQDVFEMFDRLCSLSHLNSKAKSYALAYRGECYRLRGKWSEALGDFNAALQYLPEDVWTITRRGRTYFMLERYEEALADFERATMLDKGNGSENRNLRPSSIYSRNLDFEEGMVGWFLRGSRPQDYEYGTECAITPTGNVCGYIKSQVSEPAGFGTMMQSFSAEEYRGKRLRMSASVKTEAVEQRVSLWMRVDGPLNSRSLSFDNMIDRPIQGTSDWQKYEIVLNVPKISIGIAFGIILRGKGQAWLADIQFEVVGDNIPTTESKAPRNLDFKEGMVGWSFFADIRPQDYEYGTERAMTPTGNVCGYIKARVSEPAGFGAMMQDFSAEEYRGKRLRMSASVKAEAVEQWVGLWMRVDGPFETLSFDNMIDYGRPIQGTVDWTKYEIVLDVPKISIGIAFGIILHGRGQAWLTDVQFEVVRENIPTTGR